MTERRVFNAGMYGTGRVSENLVKVFDYLNERICKFGVASRNHSNTVRFKDIYGFQKAYDSYEIMPDDPEIDFVYISTPSGIHYESIKQCLAAGKHVVCEKSITINSIHAEELYRLAEERNLILLDGIWTIYMPWIKKLKETVDAGLIGNIKKYTQVLAIPAERMIKDFQRRAGELF